MNDDYRILPSSRGCYRALAAALAALALAGLGAAHYMDTEGHWVTGMNNQVVWGLPHVFAILLILGASGALNVASMASLFGRTAYSGWSRFSGLLAISLLIGGLVVLVLDLGRPDRLIVAMTHYNFKSIFAWNIFLYTGFTAVVGVYLWFLFERRMNRYSKTAGLVAFCWRFVLTAGTGSIFGFIIARQLYHSAMMVPLFIVFSLSLGTAFFMLAARVAGALSGSRMKPETAASLMRLLGLLIALECFLVCAFHLTGLYTASRVGVGRFILLEGGIYTALFWIGQILIGALLPLGLVYLAKPDRNPDSRFVAASLSTLLGGLCFLYVTIIAGQAYPQLLFPGKQVRSTFFDGVVGHYAPSLPELALSVGGVSIAGIVLLASLRVLPFLPGETPRPSAP